MPTAKPLSKLELLPLREAWKHEAGDVTHWLAQAANLDALAEALGLGDPHHFIPDTHQLRAAPPAVRG